MMSNVAEQDQSCTRFEGGDPAGDPSNLTQLETAIEVPQQQGEIQGPTSESDEEVPSVGQFSPDEQDSSAVGSSSSIDSISLSPGQASLAASDVDQLDRQSSLAIDISGGASGKTPPAERNFVAQLVRLIGGIEIPIRRTRLYERGVEATSIDKASKNKSGIEILDTSLLGKVPEEEGGIETVFGGKSIPSESGDGFGGSDTAAGDINAAAIIPTKHPICDAAGEVSSAAEDLKKIMDKIRTASGKLSERADLSEARMEIPLAERAPITFTEKKALRSKLPNFTEIKTPYIPTQQAPSAVDRRKTSLLQTPSVTERGNVRLIQESVRPKIQLIQKAPPAIFTVRTPLTEVRSDVAEIKAKQQVTQDPSGLGRRNTSLTEVPSAAIVINAPFTQQPLSATAGRKAKPAVFGISSQLSEVPRAGAGMRAGLTHPTISASAGVKEPLTEVPSASAGIEKPFTEVPSAAIVINAPFTQQPLSAAAGRKAKPAVFGIRSQLSEVPRAGDGMRAGLTHPTISASAGVKEPLTEVPSTSSGIKEPLTEIPPAASGTSTTLTQQASSSTSGRKVKLTAACLPSWKNMTMQEARRGRGSRSMAPQSRQASLARGRRLHPSCRDLPEINVQNITAGLRGRGCQRLFPSEPRRPYRSLRERMILEFVCGVREVVDITKEKKKKKPKKKKRSKYACDDDDLSEDSWTSSDESNSPSKSNGSSPELQFHLEL